MRTCPLQFLGVLPRICGTACAPKPASSRFALPDRSRRRSGASSPLRRSIKNDAPCGTSFFAAERTCPLQSSASCLGFAGPPALLNRHPAGLRSLIGRAVAPELQVLSAGQLKMMRLAAPHFLRQRGLEPPRPCGHQPLKLACIPISPLPRNGRRTIMPGSCFVNNSACTPCGQPRIPG